MHERPDHPVDPPQEANRRSRRWFLGAAAAAGAGFGAVGTARLWLASPHHDEGPQPPETDLRDQAPRPDGRTDLTFFVAADTHFGHEGIDELNRRQIETMNALPGAPLPPPLGGEVRRPEAVLIAGDLTNYGRVAQWDEFVAHYGLTGRDGLLKFPVQECTGNHDRYLPFGTPVLDGVRGRHGSLVRGWIWQGVCFLCLDCYPTAQGCRWLRRQLKRIRPGQPAVIMFHYSITGPYSDGWSADEKRVFADAISGHNVLGIFHGHYHASTRYTWQGFDVYNVGSPRHSCHSFAAVHVGPARMTVASRWWDRPPQGSGPAASSAADRAPGFWTWTHHKAIVTA